MGARQRSKRKRAKQKASQSSDAIETESQVGPSQHGVYQDISRQARQQAVTETRLLDQAERSTKQMIVESEKVTKQIVADSEKRTAELLANTSRDLSGQLSEMLTGAIHKALRGVPDTTDEGPPESGGQSEQPAQPKPTVRMTEYVNSNKKKQFVPMVQSSQSSEMPTSNMLPAGQNQPDSFARYSFTPVAMQPVGPEVNDRGEDDVQLIISTAVTVPPSPERKITPHTEVESKRDDSEGDAELDEQVPEEEHGIYAEQPAPMQLANAERQLHQASKDEVKRNAAVAKMKKTAREREAAEMAKVEAYRKQVQEWADQLEGRSQQLDVKERCYMINRVPFNDSKVECKSFSQSLTNFWVSLICSLCHSRRRLG